jgi:hypothetical protein
MAMLLLAQAIDLTTGNIQRSKQGGCAVALVIVRHGGDRRRHTHIEVPSSHEMTFDI